MDCKLDFSDIMASTIHDTKNSLGMLLNTLDEMMIVLNIEEHSSKQQFYQLQYEIKRLNNSLIRLLALYKAEKAQLLPNIDYYSVNEFIDDVALNHEQLLNAKGITMEVEAEEGLFWAFDRGMVSGVLDNILNNTFKYARDKIKLSAAHENGCLVMRINDNGGGYPESMLFYDPDHPKFKENINFDTGSTGLGLYFSYLIARLHSKGGKMGYISLINGGTYGGGLFSLFIP